jgi:FkbM family methyltransferase
MMTNHYQSKVLRELAESRMMDFDDNFDHEQLGVEPPPAPSALWAGLAETRRRLDRSRGLVARINSLRPIAGAARYYLQPSGYFARYSAEIDRGEFLYGLLGDESSRKLLVKLIAYKILGHRKVKLPRNTPKYWRDIAAMAELRTSAPPLHIKFMDLTLYVHDLRPLSYNLTCHATSPGLACAVVQKQYEYHQGNVHCKADSGDVVVDAGGCWGETTMYFAHEAGPSGAVVAFEFIPSNLAVMRRNQDLNPHLSARVHVVENPIWSSSGLKLYYVDWGPGSRVTGDINKYHSWEGIVETTTIDETLVRLGLPRVDFIKMDIEGAELDALRGAESSIRRYRPKLAISLYHSPEDFETIPRYLAGLELGYSFYLDHHTIYQNETVLFGVPK